MILNINLDPGVFSKSKEVKEIAITFDDEGLNFLIEKLIKLKGKKDHSHLMTPSWGGNELTEEKITNNSYEIIHHLRLVKI